MLRAYQRSLFWLPGILCTLGLILLCINTRDCSTPTAQLGRIGTSATPPPPHDPGLVGVAGMASMQLQHAPRHVQRVVHHLRSIRHWQPLRSYRGGRLFRNYEGTLARGRTYYEYDVHALQPGLSRGAERLVVDESKRFFYYTKDHYKTFTQILLP